MLLLASALGIALAHPLWPLTVCAALLTWVGVAWHWPRAWMFALPAAMPMLNFSPWTGWVGVEEFDILVLGAAAAGYARLALGLCPDVPRQTRFETWVVSALACLVVIGLWRGVSDAGGWHFDWFQTYGEPLNAVRLSKSLVFVLMLLPLLRREWLADQADCFNHFASGMVVGALIMSLAVLWERSAMPGLFNIGSSYRTVALFWEMHVGGAAIDAHVALCTPFVVWALWRAHGKTMWAAAALLALLWSFVVLTTFARGAYLGAGVALLVLGWLRPVDLTQRRWRLALALTYVVGAALLLALVLDEWGYGAAALALVALGAASWLHWRRSNTRRQRALAAALLVLAVTFEVVIMFGPDSFMSARLARTAADYESRTAHWLRGVRLLEGSEDWLLGLGAGRLPAHYDRDAVRGEFSGAVDWVDDQQFGGHVRIAGPRNRGALAGRFGLTQRVPLRDNYQLALDVRVNDPLVLWARVCESHLLYDRSCRHAFVRMQPLAAGPSWQRRELTLTGRVLQRGAWYAPRQAVLTLAVLSAAAAAEVDNLVLSGADGVQLLRNSTFDHDTAHWLASAQTYFVPWHIDNMLLEVLIERGVLGVLLLIVVVAAAARRLWQVRADPGNVMPFIAAALAGLTCVGLLSSVFDVPRVALMGALLLAMGSQRVN